MLKKWVSNFALAGAIRLFLMNSEYQVIIGNRLEVSTALNSWKRVTEGIHMHNIGIDPYTGDLFHETPIGLYVFNLMQRHMSHWALCLLFIMTDLITALCLAVVAKHYVYELNTLQSQTALHNVENESNKWTASVLYISAGYLFNPYIILNCVGFTTTVFTNLLCSIVLVSITKCSIFWSCMSIALLTLQNLYPVSLIVPAAIHIVNTKHNSNKIKTVANIAFIFSAILMILFIISYHIIGSWSFLRNTIGFILMVPDLRPNIGLYWYFFTEMFEHFKWLFIASFQINVGLLYIIPLALRLRHDPMLLAFSYLSIAAIFKSYPCIGEVGFYMSLLPFWKHLFQHMQQGFIVSCFFLFSTVFAPTVWHQWIYSRSANANFYFGVTLAFAIAQIFLLTDILFASVKHEFAIRHGVNKEIGGSKAKLLLE